MQLICGIHNIVCCSCDDQFDRLIGWFIDRSIHGMVWLIDWLIDLTVHAFRDFHACLSRRRFSWTSTRHGLTVKSSSTRTRSKSTRKPLIVRRNPRRMWNRDWTKSTNLLCNVMMFFATNHPQHRFDASFNHLLLAFHGLRFSFSFSSAYEWQMHCKPAGTCHVRICCVLYDCIWLYRAVFHKRKQIEHPCRNLNAKW